jgi:hypothetical protein
MTTARLFNRYETIIAAYTAALAGRDPNDVHILDLQPAIYGALPEVTDEEILDALE